MRMRFIQVIIVFVFWVSLSCSEDEKVTPREFPRLTTLPVSNITSSGAVFNAEFAHRGNQEIIEYGFIWSRVTNAEIETSDRVFVQRNINEPSFSFEVTSSMQEGIVYKVYSYVITNEYTVYGPDIEFMSLGSQAPEITGVSKTNIHYNDTLLISGKNFSFLNQNNKVYFDSRAALVHQSADTLIKVTVPETVLNENPQLSISLTGNVTVYDGELSFIPPTITGVSKSEVVYGDTITLFGKYFGYREGLNTVKINDSDINPIETDSTAISLIIPVIDGPLTFSVTNSIGQQTLSEEVTILQLVLTNVSPDSGFWGDEITINGDNFGYREDISRVYFNGVEATIRDFSNQSFKTTLPSGLNNPIDVHVEVNGQETERLDFYYEGPEYSSISPQNGTWGETVIISGNNFSTTPSENLVSIDGIQTSIISSTNEQIIVEIPNDVVAKSSSFTVTVNGLSIQTDDFSLDRPSINSISPTIINQTGESVTISGENFHPTANRNRIEFNNSDFEILSSTSTQLVGRVPVSVLSNPLITEYIEDDVTVSSSAGSNSFSSLILDFKSAWTPSTNFNFRTVQKTYQIGDKGYVILSNASVYEFNFTTETWTRMANFPGSLGVNNTRSRGNGFVLNGDIYYGMGSNYRGNCNPTNPNIVCPALLKSDFWKFDPVANSWEQVGDAPFAGRNVRGVNVNGKSYLLSDDGFYEYNGADDTWTSLNGIPEAFWNFDFYVSEHDSKLIALYRPQSGGYKFSSYESSTDSWSEIYFTNDNLNYLVNMTGYNGNIYFTRIQYPNGSGNPYVSQLLVLDPTESTISDIPLPSDQMVFIPFKYNNMLFIDGENTDDELLKYDLNFND